MEETEPKGTELGELGGGLCWSNTQDALLLIPPLHPSFTRSFVLICCFFFSTLVADGW